MYVGKLPAMPLLPFYSADTAFFRLAGIQCTVIGGKLVHFRKAALKRIPLHFLHSVREFEACEIFGGKSVAFRRFYFAGENGFCFTQQKFCT